MESALGAVAFLLSVFSVGLGYGSATKSPRIEEPNVTLPFTVLSLISAKEIHYVGPIPWTTKQRNELSCKRESICKNTKAYVSTLGPARENTWYLKSETQFQTNWYVDYPVATVLVIPNDAPKSTRYIIDNTFEGYGLRPTINADNSDWPQSPEGRGRNVTGNFAHSFVIINESDHDVFFAKTAYVGAIPAGTYLDYWRLKPGSFSLMWPAETYWPNESNRQWNASGLEPVPLDFAAYLAESMMYDYLGPMAPLAN